MKDLLKNKKDYLSEVEKNVNRMIYLFEIIAALLFAWLLFYTV